MGMPVSSGCWGGWAATVASLRIRSARLRLRLAGPLRRGSWAAVCGRTLLADYRRKLPVLLAGLRARLGRGAGAGAAVVVMAADDVVLAEVGPVLDLDQDHRHAAGVLDAVPGAPRDIHRPPRLEPLGPPRDDHARGAGDDHPVLGPEAVPLQAEPLSRPDEEALHLVAATLLDGHEAPPGAGLEHSQGGLAARSRGAHRRIIRTKSDSTLLLTSSITSSGTSSSSSSTTMARPRRVRRPTCMEAMLTLWRPRIDPIRPTIP